MDWSRIDTQLEAVQQAVVEAAGQAAIEAERARRALERLEALERLLAEQEAAAAVGAAANGSEQTEAPSGQPAPSRSGARASLHRSPLVELFRDSAATDGPRAPVEPGSS